MMQSGGAGRNGERGFEGEDEPNRGGAEEAEFRGVQRRPKECRRALPLPLSSSSVLRVLCASAVWIAPTAEVQGPRSMLEVVHLHPADARLVPWKNGRGVTRELALWPEGASLERGDF